MPSDKHAVFIVDDDADDRESIRDAFLENKHQARYVFMQDGNELVNQLKSGGPSIPSLILLDLNMPGKDGRDALREIKSDQSLRHIPVVVLTTSSSAKDRQAAYRLGANCFVTKPDTFNQFVKLTDSIARLWLNAG
jgi:CheY-like chemotaxis protein